MMSRTTIALAAAAVLGFVSAAQANEPRDEYGGFKYGPMGQRLGGGPAPWHWRGHRNFGFAFVPGHSRVWRYERDRHDW
jgi:hypothetical protein